MQYQNIEELHPQGKKIGSLGYRPNLSIFFVLIFGIFLMAMFRNLFGIISGFFISGMAVFYLIKVKEHPVMDVYEKQLLIYEEKDPRLAILLSSDEIKEYFVSSDNASRISLRLQNGEILTISSMQKNKARVLLSKALVKKGSDEINLGDRKHFFRK